MKSLWIAGGLAIGVAYASAQTGVPPAASAPGTPPRVVEALPAVPFSNPGPSIYDTADVATLAVAGRDALASGYAPLAIEFFQEALAKRGVDTVTKDMLNLGLTTAFLSQSKLTDAAEALKKVGDTSAPAYVLRTAMLAARNQKEADATAQLAQINPDALPVTDRPWYYAMQAILAEQRKDMLAAGKAWSQAIESGTTPMQKSQFEAARMRGSMLYAPNPSANEAERLHTLAVQTTSLSLAAKYARQYVVMLDQLGPDQRAKALSAINDWLVKPNLDSLSLDYFRVLLVLIDNQDPQHLNAVRGQQELKNVLSDRLDPGSTGQEDLVNLQKIALGILESTLTGSLTSTTADPAPSTVDPRLLQRDVDDLITKQPAHPLLKQLRLLQAHLALSLKQYEEAAVAANAVLGLPADPGRDPAREDALRLLAFVASRPPAPQFRRAAEYLHSLLDALPADNPERKAVMVSMADFYFLYGDFRTAADYYSLLLNDPSPPTPPGVGVLLMRAVESELQAGQFNEALARLQQASSRNDVDGSYTYRWEAWYKVLNALSSAGNGERQPEAFALIEQLLDPKRGANLLPPGLRLRLRWLDADLAVKVESPSAADKARILQQEVEAVQAVGAGVTAVTLRQLTASALFLRLRAASLANNAKDEENFYTELTQKYADTEPAICAVFFKASELDEKKQPAQAQGLMKDMANNLARAAPDSPYLPEARFEEARYAAARGSTDQDEEAVKLFALFATTYPEHPLVYDARLQQADLLLLKLKRPGDALEVYNELLKNHASNQPFDLMETKAAMGRASCLVILAGNDLDKRKDALDELERLFNQEILPVEARVEAGWQWGTLLQSGPNPDLDKALATYWLVIDKFLKDATTEERQKLFGSLEGSFWMSECLFYSAKIYEQQKKDELARNLYQMVLDYNLANQDYAQTMLANPGSEAPPPAPSLPSTSPPSPPSPIPAPAPPSAIEAPPAGSGSATPAATGTTPANGSGPGN